MYTILFQLMYSLAWTTLTMKTVLSINLWMEMFAKVFEKNPTKSIQKDAFSNINLLFSPKQILIFIDRICFGKDN